MSIKKSQSKRVTDLPKLKFPPNKRDIPATQGMLQMVRGELKAGIRELRSEIRAEFSRSDAKLEHVLSEVSRVGVLVEEQNSNNRIVLEGLTGLWQRQERIESHIAKEVKRTVAVSLGRMKS